MSYVQVRGASFYPDTYGTTTTPNGLQYWYHLHPLQKQQEYLNSSSGDHLCFVRCIWGATTSQPHLPIQFQHIYTTAPETRASQWELCCRGPAGKHKCSVQLRTNPYRVNTQFSVCNIFMIHRPSFIIWSFGDVFKLGFSFSFSKGALLCTKIYQWYTSNFEIIFKQNFSFHST